GGAARERVVAVGAVDAAVVRHRLRVEAGDGGQPVRFAAVALQEGDLGDAAGAVGEAGELDEDVDGAVDLVVQGHEGDLDVGHGGEGLQAGEGVLGAVGVDGGEGAVVAGGHRLEHVEGLAAADLADDDAVG